MMMSSELVLVCVHEPAHPHVQGGFTALHMASQKGHCGVVIMLLEAQANVNMKSNVSESVPKGYYYK